MSRVNKPGKYMNVSKYDSSVYGASKVIRHHTESENYTKAKTLTDWLFIKYDMSYRSFSNKKKSRKDALRAEFEADTGINLVEKQQLKEHCWDDDENYDDEYDY